MNKLIPIAGLSFTFVNVLDLILTLQHFEFETNKLVLSNPTTFYVVKMISIYVILMWSWYYYIKEVKG